MARLLRGYRLDRLRGDVVAGIVLAAYLLPAGLSRASLAGFPPRARETRRSAGFEQT